MFKEIIKELLKEEMSGTKAVAQKPCTDSNYEIGEGYTIMTVLGWYKGYLQKETDKTLTLSGASWVADSGRFNEYVKDDSVAKEEEPFEEETKVIIERTSVIGSFKMNKITRKLK